MDASVITANRLHDGLVVYFTAAGGWSEQFADAAVFDRQSAAAHLAAVAEQDAGAVVGPYTIDVELEEGIPHPLGQRERLRTLGPSVRPDLGYQANRE